MKILIIEDEAGLRTTLREFLEQEKYLVETAADFEEALNKIKMYDYDCILLDIMLPHGSGLQILEELKALHKRESVIIISAKDSLDDKIAGLNLGADDYLPKPFHLTELNARIKSVLRRRVADGDKSIVIENVRMLPDDRKFFVDDKELILNRKEFDLLYYFMSNPNRLLNRTTLAEYVWGDNIDQADNFDFIYSQVKNLRRKLKDASADINIQAVYGIGYRLKTN